MRWLQFRRIIFKCGLLLSYATTAKHFLIRLWYATKSGFYTTIAMTSSVVGLRRSSKALPKAKLVPKKVMVTAWWSAASLMHYSFLNPGETITSEKYAQQIHDMCQELQCLQPALVNRKDPVLHNTWPHISPLHIAQVEQIGLWSFASSAIFTWSLTNVLLLQASQQLFAGKMLPQPAEGRKCFPRVCQIPKHGFLHYRNKQTYFSLAEMCWL